MRHQLASAACCVPILGLLGLAGGTALSAPPASTDAATTQAATLVDQALAAEARGDLAERDTLLARAIETAPRYPRAHWAARQVRSGGNWLPVPQAEAAAEVSPKLAEYRAMRDERSGTLAGEEALAIWCEQRNLPEESKWHWRNVLQFNPQHHRALKELGLHYHHGAVVSTAERAAAIHEAAKLERASTKWKLRLTHLRHDLNSKNDAKHQAAVARAQEITDPEVLPIFESLLLDKSADNKSSAFSLEMVGVFRKLSDPAFTSALVRQAVMSPWEKTRQAATAALAERDLITYAPEVLGLMHLPVERISSITTDVVGHIHYEQQLYRPGPDANDIQVDRIVFSLHHWPLFAALTNSPMPGQKGRAESIAAISVAMQQDQDRGFQMAVRQRELDRLAVERQNDDALVYNPNAIALLKANCQIDHGDAIEDWWDWWRDYNELATGAPLPDRYAYSNYRRDAYIPCCFRAGTKVSTLTGLVPIENIVAGDRVLTQDPQTGELGYKPVLATSIRPPSPMRKLTIGDEVIMTTRGHRFWQLGRGWQMSKQLETGALLYTNSEPVAIDGIEDAEDDQAYNLAVDEFHTYFVGEHRLLVHDNSAPKRVPGPLPGLHESGPH